MDPKKEIDRNSLRVRTRGELIAAIRIRLNYTQQELGCRSNLSRTQISRIERDCCNPSIKTIQKLENALDIPLMDLFINPENVEQEVLIRVEQPGAMLKQFREKLARKQVSPAELQAILNRAMISIDKKKDKE